MSILGIMQAVRQDPDLQPLRDSEEFPALINRYDEPLFDENVINVFKNMFGFMKKQNQAS